ncbi:arsenical-resistance protein ACR3 [Suhomyces tanzawaensis NRRL Y-17324]|uniref:Arsenical-resistance protein ACR3 n=1 Tax=Suhomyces tanzawaensis NRRL Y-17324 TaxID=984487 RepID=A0A1E4SCI9_9ASCO|nr:arsenical-resistance protein ACR3 [Suhomyces tanzawaensis NRRL Y-17324]ODV77176.1 arsenical-resistance protein ACR3 [Suhomyces tanzawaensis NRRL Y-17324]
MKSLSLFKQLSWTDRLLPLLIILSMIVGILISVYSNTAKDAFDSTATLAGVSIPLAMGLIVMMIPPICKMEWENFFVLIRQKALLNQIAISLVLNWIVCPFLMFGLSWMALFDNPEYRIGIIMIGMARCIAMVILWNELAGGDNTLCVVLVLVNSLLQIVLYAPYQIFFCYVITGDKAAGSVEYSLVAKSVGIFLGIPLAAGFLIRLVSLRIWGLERFTKYGLPFIGPWALIGLIYTILVIFIQKGDDFIKNIGSAFLCFIPLVLYFVIAWFGTFFLTRYLSAKTYARQQALNLSETEALLCGCEKQKSNLDVEGKLPKWMSSCSASYGETATQAFTAASNNFELSLSIAISIYSSGSKQSIAATFGPLLEVPILLLLTIVSRSLKYYYVWRDVEDEEVMSPSA